jgi:hypothetical protein
MTVSLDRGVARKKKTAAVIINKNIVNVVRIKNLGGVASFILLEYRRTDLFFPSFLLGESFSHRPAGFA